MLEKLGLAWTFVAITTMSIPAQAKAFGQSLAADSDYVKVEVRGNLHVASEYKYDPKADPRKDLGASVFAGSNAYGIGLADASKYDLLVEDRKLFDSLTASDGKKIIVSGLLEHVMLPSDDSKYGSQIRSAGQSTKMPVKFFIRVRDVRVVNAK